MTAISSTSLEGSDDAFPRYYGWSSIGYGSLSAASALCELHHRNRHDPRSAMYRVLALLAVPRICDWGGFSFTSLAHHSTYGMLLTTQIANGFIFGPVVAVLSHWFFRRRATAVAIMAFGASIGGESISTQL